MSRRYINFWIAAYAVAGWLRIAAPAIWPLAGLASIYIIWG